MAKKGRRASRAQEWSDHKQRSSEASKLTLFSLGSAYPGGNIWVFPKIVVPQNGWCIMESPIKKDDLGVPPFLEPPIS